MWSCTEEAQPSSKQTGGRTGRQKDCPRTSPMEKYANTLLYIIIIGIISSRCPKFVSYARSKADQQRSTHMSTKQMREL